MKRTALMLMLSITCLAAAWDGTKGNLTIATIGDAKHTVVSVGDIDQTVVLFSVVVQYTVPCDQIGCTPLSQTTLQYVTRVIDKLNPAPALAVFSIPLSQVKSVVVTELRVGQSEMFQ